jgi:hypothetical protein
MVGPDHDIMRARFASMTVGELRRVVTVEREDYVSQAIELAEAELRARESNADPYREPGGASPEPEDEAVTRPKPVRNLWVDVYAAMLAVSGVANWPVVLLPLANGFYFARRKALFH